jgi:preprotein translocase subunit SecE
VDTPTEPRHSDPSSSDSRSAADVAVPGEAAPTSFLAATTDELRKVVWPSRQQLFSESVAVILMVTLSAFAIAAVDRFYSWANTQVFR